MRRRRLILAVLAMAGLVFLVVAAPWWLEWVLPPVARHFGLRIGHCHSVGLSRLVVEKAVYQRANVIVTIDRLETDSPWLWYWRHLRGGSTAIAAGNWTVEVQKTKASAGQTNSGWMSLRATLQRVATALDRWLPAARVGAGRVRWPGGQLMVRSATWRAGEMKIDASQFRALTLDANVRFTRASDEIQVDAIWPGWAGAAQLTSRGPSLTGKLSWLNQATTLSAAFAPDGWLPSRGVLDLPSSQLPGDRIGFPEYATVEGRAHVDWDYDHFQGDVSCRASPAPGRSIPPLEVTAHSRGDLQELTVDALHVSIPGILAELTGPVTIDRRGAVRGNSARFSIHADLAHIRGLPGQGVVQAEARVVTNAAGISSVEFDAGAADVVIGSVRLQRAAINGRLQWPQLRVDRFSATFDEQSELGGKGGWNFRTKEIVAGEVDGTLGPGAVRRFLPAALNFEHLTIHTQASGKLENIRHSGTVEIVGFRLGKTKPAELTGKWEGAGAVVDRCSVVAHTAAAEIKASGTIDPDGLRLTGLVLKEEGREQLRLSAPSIVRWRRQIDVEPLRLAGPDGAIQVALRWGASGRLFAELRNFQSKWVSDWLDTPGPSWTIPSLAFQGSWDNAPMVFSAAGGVLFALGNGRSGQINVSLRGGPNGVQIDAVHASEGQNAVVNAVGRVPLTLEPGRPAVLRIDPAGALRLRATTVPNAAFWQQLATLTGVELRDPDATADLTGTWLHPRGVVQVKAVHLAMDPRRFARPLPSIDALDVSVVGDAGELRLDRFDFKIERQPVSITGRLPLAQKDWSEFTRDPMAFLRRAGVLRIEIPAADVAVFSRFLPSALAPAGRFQADVQYARGAISGHVRLQNAATRPLGPLGVLQQLNAEIELVDDHLVLREVKATAGGQPVVLSGTVDLPPSGAGKDGAIQPKYHVTLRGENLPFVRESGLLVRGDLALKLESPSHGPPTLSGNVTLRDSLFLADVRSFLPRGGGASPSRRPPFFSVDTAPLNTWVLAIEVNGTRCVRLRTPVFSGLASAHFRLSGTLGTPRALGEVTIDQGNVLMPFATFAVQQGSVRLTEENPYEPTIYLRGAGKHYGYDLTLEITGRASAPKIEFTSSPELGSEQVLLMVMTGAAPSNDVTTNTTHRAVQIGAFFGEGLLGSLTGGNAGEERLTIESGEKISLQGKETYDIEYKLNNRWALTGEYDEFDEYNAGFKWRVAPKRGREGDQLDGR